MPSKELTLVFNSSGGLLDVGEVLLSLGKKLHLTGHKFECKVIKAQSMAFAVLDRMCDTIVIYPGSDLLWHSPYFMSNAQQQIHLEDAEQLVKDLKQKEKRMIELIAPTFRTNRKIFAESYKNSENWKGSVFFATFNPPKKWRLENFYVPIP